MISDVAALIFMVVVVAMTFFCVWLVRHRESRLLTNTYLAIAICYTIWVMALLIMKYTYPDDTQKLFALDALTYVGVAFLPVLCLQIALVFVKGWERLPARALLLFVVPVITNIVVWTNPIHHLYYTNFSTIRSQIEFGPYIYVHGVYNYLCMIVGIILMINFMRKSPTKLYVQQGVMYTLGVVVPLTVSIVATVGIADMSIAATPLSFVTTLVFHGIAIYQLHLLDVKPIATQHVLDGISDCYLVLSDESLVLSMNQPFREVFGLQYHIEENKYLIDYAKEDSTVKTPIYNLLTAVDTCRGKSTSISYEQAVTLDENENGTKRRYYVVEVQPLMVNASLTGFVCIFKDITALKNSLQQLESSRNRMVEQERLAFLGQMVGGLAHNLKTPIMSISGGASAMENLIEESRRSLGDPDVNEDDYREIYGEMDGWIVRIRESCSYMSDIITAIKGQATSASISEDSTFTVEDLVRRVTLLMRHELISSQCQLVSECNVQDNITLHGDVNNLIQVLNNLISNAIYSQKQNGGGKIVLGVEKDNEYLKIYVKDTGKGIEKRVRDRLFKEMITSKGTQGTGLGLYISNAVVKGKFGGNMWAEDNPEGGAIIGLSIPFENVTFTPTVSAPEMPTQKESDAQ